MKFSSSNVHVVYVRRLDFLLFDIFIFPRPPLLKHIPKSIFYLSNIFTDRKSDFKLVLKLFGLLYEIWLSKKMETWETNMLVHN